MKLLNDIQHQLVAGGFTDWYILNQIKEAKWRAHMDPVFGCKLHTAESLLCEIIICNQLLITEMPTNKTQRSHWNNLRTQMLSICVSSRIVLPCVDLVVCVWRLLLVSIDELDFICKEVYIPLSYF